MDARISVPNGWPCPECGKRHRSCAKAMACWDSHGKTRAESILDLRTRKAGSPAGRE